MKKILLSALAMVALASCSKENVEVDAIDSNVVRLSSGIATRASGTEWAATDSLSVFAKNSIDAFADAYAMNKKYTTSGSGTSADFTPATGDDYIFYPTQDIDICAIYPYAASTTVTSYAIDVADQKNHPAIDLMVANKGDLAISGKPVDMTFDHKLSQIEVKLVAATNGGFKDSDLETVKIEVLGTKVAGNYNLTTDAISTSGDADVLELKAVKNEATFMVIPQTATPEFIITVSNVEYKVVANEIAMASGKSYAYKIAVSRTAVEINGFTINKWTTENQGDLEADDYEEPLED